VDWAERGFDPVPLIERCRDYFSTVRYNEIPVILQDMILAPAMGYGNRGSSCIAVRLRPMEERWAGDMHIPIVPLPFLNYIAMSD
jgi:hypothetical protein